jgi:hypothetical protein
MNKSVLISFLIISASLMPFSRASGQEVFGDSIIDKRIKSAQIYRDGWNLSFPSIKLQSDDRLALNFDLLDDHAETYYYSFIHCDKNWNKSQLAVNDYLEGFYENPIEDYKPSFNTTVNYFHYKAIFPNERIKFKLSGNYIVTVYKPDEPENTALMLRFIVTEDAAKIGITMHRPQNTSGDNARQQVEFTVSPGNLAIKDPYRDIYSFVLQNGRWNNAKKNLKPEYYGNNELKYSALSQKNIFMGGNEFRYFDIKSIRYVSEYIKSMEYNAPYYNVLLKPSENREFKPYFYWKDFNGTSYIATADGKDPDTDADYLNVYFTLPAQEKVGGGNMYVSGAFNNWLFNTNNRMIYNQQKKQYECSILLKQGWYNYEYVFLKDGDTEGVASKFEGSHYETENDYMVIVYYRNPGARYDRIIGTASANTLNHLSY